MDWMPFELIVTLSDHGLLIVTGLGGAVLAPLVVWKVQELVQRQGNPGRQNRRLPRWVTILFFIPVFIYLLFVVFYFFVESQGGFQIETELFDKYDYVGRTKRGMPVGKGRLFDPNDGNRLVYIGFFGVSQI